MPLRNLSKASLWFRFKIPEAKAGCDGGCDDDEGYTPEAINGWNIILMEVCFRSCSFLFMGDGCRFQPVIFQDDDDDDDDDDDEDEFAKRL